MIVHGSQIQSQMLNDGSLFLYKFFGGTIKCGAGEKLTNLAVGNAV